MKILTYSTSLSCKYISDACQIIEQKNKNVKFLHGFKKKKFTELEKKNLLYLKNKKVTFINKESEDKKIDFKYLRYFEKKIAIDNIWKMISADRNYGRAYINDVDDYYSLYSSKNSNKILLNFIETAKSIEKIFKKFKPNYVFIANGLSGIEVTIIESFARYFKSKIITPESTRFKNYIFFADNLKSLNLEFKKNYFKTKKKYTKSKEIDKIFNEISNIKSSISADAIETKNTISKLLNKNIFQIIFGKTIYSVLKHIYLNLLFFLNIKNNHLKFLQRYNLFLNISSEIKLNKNLKYLISLEQPNLNKKYIYYPIHLNPETSTLLKGNEYMNQESLIESISKNIPCDHKLYIKEHPAMLVSHPRKLSFYERIRELPNVKLINPSSDSRKIINRAATVIVVDGSSGFEAMISNIPLVTMKQFNYDFLDLSVTNTKIDNLNTDIENAIKKNQNIKKQDHELKIKILLKSIIDHSYKLRDPDTFFYFNKEMESKEKDISAQDLASALIKELKL